MGKHCSFENWTQQTQQQQYIQEWNEMLLMRRPETSEFRALLALILYWCLLCPTHSYFLDPSIPIHSLQLQPDILFQWQVLENELTVEVDFSQSREGRDWIAVGFSDYGELRNADLCVAWVDWKGNHYLEDIHTNNNYTMILDEIQDCQDFEYQEFSNGLVSFKYTRPLRPCHSKEDYSIEDGTVHVVWARGPGSLYEVNGLNISDKGISESGFARTRILKVDPGSEDASERRLGLNITHKVDVGDDDTTYWCSSHKLHPRLIAEKHQIIEYFPKITEGNEDVVHHMEVFQCDGPPELEFPLWSGPCGHENAPQELQMCKKVLAAWAIGAGPFVYPKEAGVAFGGPQSNPFIMLEVHYNNPSRRSGIQDESGMTLIITPDVREYDAGILELGLIYSDLMAIPPSSPTFPLSGHCLPQCTAVGLPEEGIIIFGSQLHTHQTGTRVVTRHFRNGQELPEINRDDHYSAHFQEIRLLHKPRRVLPGDYLQTTCVYDTTNRPNVTLGGFRFSDEMCVNYVHYYPRTNLEICKSSVDSDALKQYFQFLNEWSNEGTNPSKSVKENYGSITWNPLQRLTLQNFYETSPEIMQCTWGYGQDLPGKWRDMSKPEVQEDHPQDSCPRSNRRRPWKRAFRAPQSKKEKGSSSKGKELWFPNKSDVQQFNPSFTRLIRKKNTGYKRDAQSRYPRIEPTFTRLIKKLKPGPTKVTKKPWSPKALRMRKRLGVPFNEMKRSQKGPQKETWLNMDRSRREERIEDYDSWGIDKRTRGGGLGSIPLPI